MRSGQAAGDEADVGSPGDRDGRLGRGRTRLRCRRSRRLRRRGRGMLSASRSRREPRWAWRSRPEPRWALPLRRSLGRLLGRGRGLGRLLGRGRSLCGLAVGASVGLGLLGRASARAAGTDGSIVGRAGIEGSAGMDGSWLGRHSDNRQDQRHDDDADAFIESPSRRYAPRPAYRASSCRPCHPSSRRSSCRGILTDLVDRRCDAPARLRSAADAFMLRSSWGQPPRRPPVPHPTGSGQPGCGAGVGGDAGVAPMPATGSSSSVRNCARSRSSSSFLGNRKNVSPIPMTTALSPAR